MVAMIEFFMTDMIFTVLIFLVGFSASYFLFYGSVIKKYSKIWAYTNVAIWGFVLTMVMLVIKILLIDQ